MSTPTPVLGSFSLTFAMAMFTHVRLHVFLPAILAGLSFYSAAQTEGPHERVVRLFQMAQAAEQSEDYAHAAGCYGEIVLLDPKIAEAWSNLGMSLYRLQKYDEAVTAFQRAISLKPFLLAPHLFEGKAYLDLGQPEKALTPLKSALAIAPTRPETLLALGDAYAMTHQYPSSVQMLRVALKQSPDSEDVGSRLAVTYLEWASSIGVKLKTSSSVYGSLLSDEELAAAQPEPAEVAFRNTVTSAPSLLEARLSFAAFLMSNHPSPERLQASKEQIEIAKRISPQSPEVNAASIRHAIVAKDFLGAATELRSLMQSAPVFTLANLETLTGGLPEDLAQNISAELHRATDRKPPSQTGYSSKLSALERIRSRRRFTPVEAADFASAAWHLHRYDDALNALAGQTHNTDEGEYWLFRTTVELGKRSLEQTVGAHPDSFRSHLLLANLALQQENVERAGAEYQAALALRPDDAETQLLNVRFLETARDTDRALEASKRGAAEFPHDAQLNFEAGDLILKTGGDPLAAITFLQQSVSSDPKPTMPHVDLADAYAQAQKIDQAIAEMNKVVAADKDGSMHYRLARWYRQSGRAREAADALELSKKMKESKIKGDVRTLSIDSNPHP